MVGSAHEGCDNTDSAWGLHPAEVAASKHAHALVGVPVQYGIPMLCRLTLTKDSFQRGPFHLRAFSAPVGWGACLFIAFNMVRCVAALCPAADAATDTHAGGHRVTSRSLVHSACMAWPAPFPQRWAHMGWCGLRRPSSPWPVGDLTTKPDCPMLEPWRRGLFKREQTGLVFVRR